MSRIVYVNGRYLPYSAAGVHVEDRGFQFADSVYEVCEVRGGRLIDETRHLDRLARSLSALEIPFPMGRRALGHILRETLRRNRVTNGLVYLQVTRGTARRDFPFPEPEADPTVVCLARRIDPAKSAARAEAGIRVVSQPDIRWGRCDLKTVMLLPACLAKEEARRQGASEAWFVDGKGFVTEGASSNAWIVSSSGTLLTRPLDEHILGGVTRRTLLDVIGQQNLTFEERPFTLDEVYTAREAFISSASATITPVVAVNGRTIGSGRPGPVTRTLREKFHQVAEISAL